MSYTQYYYQPADKALSAAEIKRRVGVDVATYGATGLTSLGIYPITDAVQPYNTELYSVARTFTINGANADETWTPTSRTLALAKLGGERTLVDTVTGRIINLINASGYSLRIFVTVASQLIGDRPARFSSWVTRRIDATTQLDSYMTSVNSAATVDAVNALVSPAWGCLNIARDPANPNNLLASDFTADKFYAKTLSKGAFELHFPQTSTTVTYSSGFAATAAAFTDGDKTVQLRRTSNSLVVDEFIVPEAATAADSVIEFGYRKYLNTAILGAGTSY